MKIEEIKKQLKSGDIAGAAEAAEELLKGDPDNVRAMMLFGTCRQLQGDEATFRDTYRVVKEHLEAKPDVLDADTNAAWKRFDGLRIKLDQPELLRKGARPRSPVMMEYVVLAVLIAAAVTMGVLLFEGEIRQMFSQEEQIYNGGHLYGGDLYAGPVRDELNRADTATSANKFFTQE